MESRDPKDGGKVPDGMYDEGRETSKRKEEEKGNPELTYGGGCSRRNLIGYGLDA